MNISKKIAKYFKEVQLDGKWIANTNLKETLSDVTWQEATTKVYSLNTIAALVFHINYYVSAVLEVLQGGELNAHDKYSFDCPPIESQEDWEKLLNKAYADAEAYTEAVAELSEEKLFGDFADKKYGTYYRNLQGMIEHSYYHFGQIVLIKKIILEMKKEG